MQRLRSLPKAEVHLHIEGCLEPALLEALARKSGEPMPRPSEELLRFSGLADFLAFLDWACGLVRTREQMAKIAYALAQRLAASGAGYADAIINPTHWTHWRHRVRELVEALDAGFRAAEQDRLPQVGLCISVLREQSAAEALELVDLLAKMGHPRVVALSVDGNEALAGRTGPRFADAFRRAGDRGLRRTVHAGESSGPEGVRDAIDLLGADRIDHGVRAIEEPDLVRRLADLRVPLGICPSSNLTLGLYRTMAGHPIEALRRAGVLVSVNTDDPALLGTTLEREYALCAEAFAWNDEVLRSVARTSIDASFASAETKARLSAALADW